MHPTTDPIRRMAVEYLRAQPRRLHTREMLQTYLDHYAHAYCVGVTPECLEQAWALVPVWDRAEEVA